MWIFFCLYLFYLGGSPGGALVKNPPGKAGDAKMQVQALGQGKSPGEGNGNPL